MRAFRWKRCYAVDVTFEKWERRPRKMRKVNGLAFCAQEVLAAAEELKEAAVGAAPRQPRDTGLDQSAVAEFIRHNAEQLDQVQLPATARALAQEAASNLRDRQIPCRSGAGEYGRSGAAAYDRRGEAFCLALAATPDEAIFQVRSEADRDLAPYRRKMSAPQIEQLQKQYVHKRLLEQYHVPRLSLFYM